MTSDPQVPPPPEPEPEPPPVVEPAKKPAADSAPKSPRGFPPQPTVPFTRIAAAWWALIVGSLVLIVLLVFIGQNLHSAPIQFFGWQWNAPVGISFLVAAICGSLITVMTGGARMLQLRRVAKKNVRTNRRPSIR